MRARDRILVVNADDFGQSHGVNRGIIEAHERGIVTSASLMVRWPAAREAVDYWRVRRSLGLGLHLDLGEWSFVSGQWKARYEVVDLGDPEGLAAEIDRQIDVFVRLADALPTHLDSHQHVHTRPEVLELVAGRATRIGVPLRHVTEGIRYCGEFHGQDAQGAALHEQIGVAALKQLLKGLPAGVTELACHPGFADDVDTTYRDERAMEVMALCEPSLRDFLRQANIELCSFDRLRAVAGG